MSGALRVAIIGAGPSGFYAADHLLKEAPTVEVDMFDRLPTPFGLVRHGVAPDHLKIKSVTRAFTATAANPRFRFFGTVEFGRQVTLADLQHHYHAVIFATGAPADRRMDIPGEDLQRSETATAFVAWYNGHPDYRHCGFDLSQETVAVVGMGNVALDVARILCLSPEELKRTDMAAHAVEALCASGVRDVYLLARRGPAQAACTTPEIKEFAELADADVVIDPAEVALDPISQREVEESHDPMLVRKVEMFQSLSARAPQGRPRRLHVRFFVSPVSLENDGTGSVGSMRLAHNALRRNDAGTVVAEATGTFETIPAGLVFRSVGYRGVALPGVPFNDRWAVVLNRAGRVLETSTNDPVAGLYVTGWAKRGPSGVIGTNKPDAQETANALLADAAAGRLLTPATPDREAIRRLVVSRQGDYFTFDDWLQLDALEIAAGEAAGRPRAKFTSVAEMRGALGRPGEAAAS